LLLLLLLSRVNHSSQTAGLRGVFRPYPPYNNQGYASYRLMLPATPPFCYSESSANFFRFFALLIVFEKFTFFRFFFLRSQGKKPIFCKKKEKTTFVISHHFQFGIQILIPQTISR
jgi:hypothetical protein